MTVRNNLSGTSMSSRSRKFSTRQRLNVFSPKRIAVKNAHASIRKILMEFKLPLVKKTFDQRIVRVCCRTVVQLENIAVIMAELIKFHLIKEVGMPLEHSFTLKSLVIFIKPVDIESSMKLDHVFQYSSFKYHHVVINVPYPTVTAKEVFEKSQNTANVRNTNMESRKSAEEDECNALLIKVYDVSYHFVILIGIWVIISGVCQI